MTRLEKLLELRERVNAEIAHELRMFPPLPRYKARTAQHGTESGYKRHRLDGTPTCTACKAAHRLGNKRREQRRKTAA